MRKLTLQVSEIGQLATQRGKVANSECTTVIATCVKYMKYVMISLQIKADQEQIVSEHTQSVTNRTVKFSPQVEL